MANRHAEEFKHEAVRIALTSELTRRQVSSDLGIGFSTLSKCTQQPATMKRSQFPIRIYTKKLNGSAKRTGGSRRSGPY